MKAIVLLGILIALVAGTSCSHSGPVVTVDNAAKAPLMLNFSGVGVDRVTLRPDQGAEFHFDESFPRRFNIDRLGKAYFYRLSFDPAVLKRSALIVADDMRIYLVQDGKVRNPQPEGFPLVPLN